MILIQPKPPKTFHYVKHVTFVVKVNQLQNIILFIGNFVKIVRKKKRICDRPYLKVSKKGHIESKAHNFSKKP